MNYDHIDIRTDPRTRSVVKKKVTREVMFAARAGVCDTLEGRVPYKAGDAIVTGGRGERWPVSRASFLAAYEPTAGVAPGEDGLYVSKPVSLHALRLDRAASVSAGVDGRLAGESGDWLVRYADGSAGILKDEIFRDTYDLG